MKDAPQIKGWCPGAFTPMRSGDGLLVRVRPFNGRLRRAQADGLASLAAAHGNGLMDMTSRGNIQLRGVSEESYPALMEGLDRMALLDASPEIEARRNVMVTPFWQAESETARLIAEMTRALQDESAPTIPAKFGFVVDTGAKPVLQSAPGDIRLERDVASGLLLAAHGSDVGKSVTSDTIVAEAMTLAQWFVETCGTEKRMGAHLARGHSLPEGHNVPRQKQTYAPAPGATPLGVLVGLAFGQLQVETLAALAKHGGLRMTPWRMLLIEGAEELPEIEGLIVQADDPLLRVVACTGAPRCVQGHVETRPLARALAAHIPKGGLCHVSGCAKGCAHPKSAPLTVAGTPQGLNLIRNGRAADTPEHTTLSPDDLIKVI